MEEDDISGSVSKCSFVSVCSCTFGGLNDGDEIRGESDIGFGGGSIVDAGIGDGVGATKDTDERDGLTPDQLKRNQGTK